MSIFYTMDKSETISKFRQAAYSGDPKAVKWIRDHVEPESIDIQKVYIFYPEITGPVRQLESWSTDLDVKTVDFLLSRIDLSSVFTKSTATETNFKKQDFAHKHVHHMQIFACCEPTSSKDRIDVVAKYYLRPKDADSCSDSDDDGCCSIIHWYALAMEYALKRKDERRAAEFFEHVIDKLSPGTSVAQGVANLAASYNQWSMMNRLKEKRVTGTTTGVSNAMKNGHLPIALLAESVWGLTFDLETCQIDCIWGLITWDFDAHKMHCDRDDHTHNLCFQSVITWLLGRARTAEQRYTLLTSSARQSRTANELELFTWCQERLPLFRG